MFFAFINSKCYMRISGWHTGWEVRGSHPGHAIILLGKLFTHIASQVFSASRNWDTMGVFGQERFNVKVNFFWELVNNLIPLVKWLVNTGCRLTCRHVVIQVLQLGWLGTNKIFPVNFWVNFLAAMKNIFKKLETCQTSECEKNAESFAAF